MSDRYHFFGEIALASGLVTTAQLLEALTEQAHDRAEGLPVTMLGQLLLEKGYMTEEQVQDVLDELFPPEPCETEAGRRIAM